MLCHDGFHPSADGYRVIAYALFPELAAAANLLLADQGLGQRRANPPGIGRPRFVLIIAQANPRRTCAGLHNRPAPDPTPALRLDGNHPQDRCLRYPDGCQTALRVAEIPILARSSTDPAGKVGRCRTNAQRDSTPSSLAGSHGRPRRGRGVRRRFVMRPGKQSQLCLRLRIAAT